MQRLNLGCGYRKLEGYVNVDKFAYCKPDQVVDLEFPIWPWPDESVTEIQAVHVLEHLGQTPDGFISIMKEMYRVLVDGGLVTIIVPHPRSDGFVGDPTHVRIINSDVLSLFSQRFNRLCIERGWASTTLGLYHGIDFEAVEIHEHLSGTWAERFAKAKEIGDQKEIDEITTATKERFNVISETKIVLRKVKH